MQWIVLPVLAGATEIVLPEPCVEVVAPVGRSRRTARRRLLEAHLDSLGAPARRRPPSGPWCLFEHSQVEDVGLRVEFAPPPSVARWEFYSTGWMPDGSLVFNIRREYYLIQVFEDPAASSAAGEDVFLVAGEPFAEDPSGVFPPGTYRRSDEVVAYYAIFLGEPKYTVLKALVLDILDGRARPLGVVTWPAEGGAPVVDLRR